MEKTNTVSKNRTSKMGEKFSYKYVDIAQIHEYLASINASYYQYIDRIGDDDYIMTVRIIGGKEKPALRGCRVVTATLQGNTNPAQIQGSALTYARRYSLLMAFGLATEDDDAQSLNQQRAEPTQGAKASEKQVALLKRFCNTEEKMQRLLNANGVAKVEDIPSKKASEIIGKLMEAQKK